MTCVPSVDALASPSPPSMIVVLAPEPTRVKLLPMVRFSVYVAEATTIESPEAASEMACLIVLQAVVGDTQLLRLLPVTPFTYYVLAMAVETKARNATASSKQERFSFTICSFLTGQLYIVGRRLARKANASIKKQYGYLPAILGLKEPRSERPTEGKGVLPGQVFWLLTTGLSIGLPARCNSLFPQSEVDERHGILRQSMSSHHPR